MLSADGHGDTRPASPPLQFTERRLSDVSDSTAILMSMAPTGMETDNLDSEDLELSPAHSADDTLQGGSH